LAAEETGAGFAEAGGRADEGEVVVGELELGLVGPDLVDEEGDGLGVAVGLCGPAWEVLVLGLKGVWGRWTWDEEAVDGEDGGGEEGTAQAASECASHGVEANRGTATLLKV
jgi:hypothetical protein